ncbi:hypothetical protein V8G54_028699, partial [Vigna mungo]
HAQRSSHRHNVISSTQLKLATLLAENDHCELKEGRKVPCFDSRTHKSKEKNFPGHAATPIAGVHGSGRIKVLPYLPFRVRQGEKGMKLPYLTSFTKQPKVGPVREERPKQNWKILAYEENAQLGFKN